METVAFHTEEGFVFSLPDPSAHADWIASVADRHGQSTDELTYIFSSDEYLHKVNLEHLDHDTYTDIVTFDYAEEGQPLAGDIFISVDRVKENAEFFGEPFERELRRVMIHGVLHLLGFADKTDEEKALMRAKEDEALAMFHVEH